MSKLIKLLSITLLFIGILAGCSAAASSSGPNTDLWHHYLIYPMSLLIVHVAKAWIFQSFGFAIMIVTVGVRMLLMPLNVMQYKNQLNMKRLQPQLKELKKKYSSKHAEEQKQYQVEMMKLMQENKANPMMGCLPLIVQLPVFSAVYYAIRQTKEISSASFLWLNLGHPDPYYVLPLLAACMTYIQAKVVQTNVPAEQMAQVRMMQLMSPVMVLMFGFASPSGLVLYWLTGSIFMIAQYTVLKKLYRNETASA
ncbi:membrane protein insertase YidC [Ectobacillus funiculus]|uniref:membrane protein insertase YidC n=1 Tax=Ectobacillus funiculus TaxID=137993 RepID=UPI00397A2D46